jgi:hypothetical protein
MYIENHYLSARASFSPLRTNIRWNDKTLSPALQGSIEKIASWKELDAQSGGLFKGFVPSGKRSYVCVLSESIETPIGPSSAVKLKAIGKTGFTGHHPPTVERFDLDPHVMVVDENGFVSVEKTRGQPLFGATMERVETENAFMGLANGEKLPAPYALGVGEYPDLVFEGENLGYNIIALSDWRTDVRRIGNIFQNGDDCSSPEEYLLGVARDFFSQNASLRELEILFYEAGRVQRQFNNNGLISNDCHVGNFALTAEAVLNDFGKGKRKDELSAPQTSIYQLLDMNRFLFSAYRLRAWPVGELFLSRAHPLSAYLEGYFGREIFERHIRAIGTPEKMVRGLLKPEIQQDQDKNGFKGSMEIMKYSWTCLYDALQDVLAGEGNAFQLNAGERIKRYVGIFKSFFDPASRDF